MIATYGCLMRERIDESSCLQARMKQLPREVLVERKFSLNWHATMNPHRARRGASRRQEFLLGGIVIAGNGTPAANCVVHDRSPSGARLELERTRAQQAPTASAIPERVTLYFCPTRTEIDCRVAWRDGRHIGVEFISKERPARLDPGTIDGT